MEVDFVDCFLVVAGDIEIRCCGGWVLSKEKIWAFEVPWALIVPGASVGIDTSFESIGRLGIFHEEALGIEVQVMLIEIFQRIAIGREVLVDSVLRYPRLY